MSDLKIVQLIPAPGWRVYTVGISADDTTWDAEDEVVAFALRDDGSVCALVSDEGFIVPIESLSGPNTCERLLSPSQKVTPELKERLEFDARSHLASSKGLARPAEGGQEKDGPISKSA